ncbi:hypothetical protein Droror1_Dr00016884 [Drosera rotundifolia]
MFKPLIACVVQMQKRSCLKSKLRLEALGCLGSGKMADSDALLAGYSQALDSCSVNVSNFFVLEFSQACYWYKEEITYHTVYSLVCYVNLSDQGWRVNCDLQRL